jgi:hypothetical protein
MRLVARRLIAGVGAITIILVERASIARKLIVTTMRRSRMIVQRMDRRRGQQITGKRQNSENLL